MAQPKDNPYIAIACGGTGGHLFPGMAIAEVLRQNGCDVALLISRKLVDQEVTKSISDLELITLAAVALQGRNGFSFLRGTWASYRICRRAFRGHKPDAVLAMGGFTSAAPVLAGKRHGARVFLHEANSVPGRAVRWLAPFADEVFLTFSAAAAYLSGRRTLWTGMPVRPQFEIADAGACRRALGLAPDRPVLLIMGGSQGATAVNQLLVEALPMLLESAPDLQFLHLTGAQDLETVRAGYDAFKCRARIMPFLTEMELALGAASLAIGRAGASSLAELAAMRVPSVLIPYPFAADNHQFHNAQALVKAGGARQVDQKRATAKLVCQMVVELLRDEGMRERMRAALARWHVPDAAEQIACRLMKCIGSELHDFTSPNGESSTRRGHQRQDVRLDLHTATIP